MGDVLDDLEGEHAALDAIVAPLPDPVWHTATPAEGWDIADTITHLALSDEAALGSVEGRGKELFEGIMSDPDTALAGQAKAASELSPPEVLDWWRTARGAVLAAMRATPPGTRVYWGIGEMSVKSMS